MRHRVLASYLLMDFVLYSNHGAVNQKPKLFRMSDVTLEILRAVVVLGIVVYLWFIGRGRFEGLQSGWNAIIAGFGLLLFGSLVDITDNFDALNKFVVIGDTETEAFLEKFVGFLGGFIVLAFGLIRWMPSVQRLSDEIVEKRRVESELRYTHDVLERRIEERTATLTSRIEALRSEIAERQQKDDSAPPSKASFSRARNRA